MHHTQPYGYYTSLHKSICLQKKQGLVVHQSVICRPTHVTSFLDYTITEWVCLTAVRVGNLFAVYIRSRDLAAFPVQRGIPVSAYFFHLLVFVVEVRNWCLYGVVQVSSRVQTFTLSAGRYRNHVSKARLAFTGLCIQIGLPHLAQPDGQGAEQRYMYIRKLYMTYFRYPLLRNSPILTHISTAMELFSSSMRCTYFSAIFIYLFIYLTRSGGSELLPD